MSDPNPALVEKVAETLWPHRVARADLDMYEDVTWDQAITSRDICIAYEVQEVRADAAIAIAAILPDGHVVVSRTDLREILDVAYNFLEQEGMTTILPNAYDRLRDAVLGDDPS